MSLEATEQAAFIAWLRDVAALRWPTDCIDGYGFPYVTSFSAGRRSQGGIGWAKKQGLRPGVPDVFIPIPRGNWAGLWVEMKRSEGRAVVSAAQSAWLGWLNLHGYCGRICYGAEAAISVTTVYMTGGVP